MSDMPKFIQITTATDLDGDHVITALDELGQVWIKSWRAVAQYWEKWKLVEDDRANLSDPQSQPKEQSND